MSYFLARVFDKEAFIGRTIKNLDDNIKVFLIKNKKIFILTYLFLFIKVDPKWRINMKGVLRVGGKCTYVTYSSTASRVVHYMKLSTPLMKFLNHKEVYTGSNPETSNKIY
ncbi:unnamed protein product [Rhizophagus irregularis]|nr:unnamed protein product [Rhizophagus irregularis]